MENLYIYEQGRKVPSEAKKPINAGRLKGMTDINPMWRIKKLTELFGPCGIGWWYVIKDKHTESATYEDSNGNAITQVAAFVDIDLCYASEGKVSMPIPGTGGSMFLVKETKGFYVDDECYKKALTDAISVAAKALGIGADVYWDKDSTKYSGGSGTVKEESKGQGNADDFVPQCADCEAVISIPEHEYSVKKYNRPLCRSCQQKADAPATPPAPAVRCQRCGCDIKPYISPKNGKTVTAEAHAARSMAVYKGVLCLKCIEEKEDALKRVEDYGKQLAGEAR